TLFGACTDATFCRAPGELLGKVGQIGRVEIGIHPPRLEAHSSDVELLIGKLGVRILVVHLVDRTIDFLADGSRQLLIAGGGQLLDAFLFETGSQLCLAAALRTISWMARGQLP